MVDTTPADWSLLKAIRSALGRYRVGAGDFTAPGREVSRRAQSALLNRRELAIGWALRQHARTEPDWVRAEVARLGDRPSGQSRREALKHLAMR